MSDTLIFKGQVTKEGTLIKQKALDAGFDEDQVDLLTNFGVEVKREAVFQMRDEIRTQHAEVKAKRKDRFLTAGIIALAITYGGLAFLLGAKIS
jgi:hypothetical protein